MERLKYAAFKSATGDIEETRRISTEMTTQAPDYLPGWTLLAELAFKDKKYDEALSLLENVLAGTRNTSMATDWKARCCWQRATQKKRSKFWSDSTKRIPTPPHQIPIGTRISQNNNLNQAKVALDQAISINPNFADAILLLAEINLRSGHGETVIEPITNLLRKRPDLRSAAFLLAAAYGSLDRFDDAERSFATK